MSGSGLGVAPWSTRRVCGEKRLVVLDHAFDQSPELLGFGMLASGQRGLGISIINITMLALGQRRLFPDDRGAIGSEKLLNEGFAPFLDERPAVIRRGR